MFIKTLYIFFFSRYQDEDRDLEAQMLAKGLRLIPMKKVGSKYSV